ncbi:MAG: hypothetical protein NTZ10_04485 [Candidatus Saganbacteria bacterium]|nr:hypothetical protein [Candidatus Saganbacteria bacterium]
MLPREEAVPITATGVDFLSAFDIAEVTVDALNHPEVVGFAKIALHLFANNYETICHALDPDTTIAGIFRPYSNVTTPEYAMTLPKWFSPRLNGEGAILMTGKPLGAGEFNTKGQKVIGLFAQLGLTIPPEDSIWLSWFRLWDDGAAHQATFGIPFPLLTAYKQQKMGQ